MKIFRSSSSEITKTFGHDLAEKIARPKGPDSGRDGAFVIALKGDLGAGKTTFTQGFFKGLGIRRNPVSPTFVIMRHYKIPGKKTSPAGSSFADVYHFDAYRLRKAEDLAVLGFDNILSEKRNIILIEWPEKVQGILPRGAMTLEFSYGKKENERTIKIK